jgi:hypothetical protein
MTPPLYNIITTPFIPPLKNLTLNFLLVVTVLGLQVTDLDAASALRVDRGTEDRDGNWDLLIARKGGGNDEVANLELSIHDGASIALNLWSTANEWKTRGAWLAAHLAVEAAKTNLSGATGTVHILYDEKSRIRRLDSSLFHYLLKQPASLSLESSYLVDAAVNAAKGAA